jgi:hypothetical protein
MVNACPRLRGNGTASAPVETRTSPPREKSWILWIRKFLSNYIIAMFKQLTHRMASAMGMDGYALESLEDIDLDSVDSVSLSDTDSTYSSHSSSSIDMGSAEELEAFAKRQVIKLVRCKKKSSTSKSSETSRSCRYPISWTCCGIKSIVTSV